MVSDDIRAILNRIDWVLAEKGMPKSTFYAKSGISSASFAQWNKGVHKPTKIKLAKAAEVLGVSIDYLLTGATKEEDKKEKPSTENGERLDYSDMELLEAIRKADAKDLKAIRVILGIE